jgi:hypothetical protein
MSRCCLAAVSLLSHVRLAGVERSPVEKLTTQVGFSTRQTAIAFGPSVDASVVETLGSVVGERA